MLLFCHSVFMCFFGRVRTVHEPAQAVCNIVGFAEYPGESLFETVFEPLEPFAFRCQNEEPDTEEQKSLEYRQEQA